MNKITALLATGIAAVAAPAIPLAASAASASTPAPNPGVYVVYPGPGNYCGQTGVIQAEELHLRIVPSCPTQNYFGGTTIIGPPTGNVISPAPAARPFLRNGWNRYR